jgi:hypothetical protein
MHFSSPRRDFKKKTRNQQAMPAARLPDFSLKKTASAPASSANGGKTYNKRRNFFIIVAASMDILHTNSICSMSTTNNHIQIAVAGYRYGSMVSL